MRALLLHSRYPLLLINRLSVIFLYIFGTTIFLISMKLVYDTVHFIIDEESLPSFDLYVIYDLAIASK